MLYSHNDSENYYVLMKRKPRQAYSDYSKIENFEKEINSRAKKQQKKNK